MGISPQDTGSAPHFTPILGWFGVAWVLERGSEEPPGEQTMLVVLNLVPVAIAIALFVGVLRLKRPNLRVDVPRGPAIPARDVP